MAADFIRPVVTRTALLLRELFDFHVIWYRPHTIVAALNPLGVLHLRDRVAQLISDGCTPLYQAASEDTLSKSGASLAWRTSASRIGSTGYARAEIIGPISTASRLTPDIGVPCSWKEQSEGCCS